MPSQRRFLAIKSLTRSDLTFFKYHYDRASAENPTSSRQKSINLNRDVFVDVMYPGLVAGTNLPVTLRVAGPTGDDEQALQRKIIRSTNSKNWRLDGEVVPDPEEDSARYHRLVEGDYAVLEFEGDARPSSVRCVLVSAEANPGAHAYLAAFMVAKGAESMAAMAGPELDLMLASLDGEDRDPVSVLSDQALTEELVFGGGAARTPGIGPAITAGEFAARREAIARVGLSGEQLYAGYLDREVELGTIDSYEWVSLEHAAAPMDFVVSTAGTEFEVEVKTTSLHCEQPFHLSAAEARRLVELGDRYRVIRVYDLVEGAAKYREVRGLAPTISIALAALQVMPDGVTADSISVDLRRVVEVELGEEAGLGGQGDQD